jgi:biopolymer transport protein ExbD
MIPTASMADIAFLLIIFFMVTTVHEVDRTSVNLPVAKFRTDTEKGAAIVVMAKQVDKATGAESLVYKFSDGEQMSKTVGGPQDIYFEATAVISKDPTTQFILKADGTVEYDKVDEMLDQMRDAGVSNVLLLTQQNSEGSEG